MATKKKIAKWIRKQAEKLPKVTYEAAIKYAKPVLEKGEDNTIRVVAGEWTNFPINHARRAKRAYNRGGREGINAYFLKYGFHLVKQ